MNYPMIVYLLAQILRLEGLLMLLSVFYADSALWAILGTALGLRDTVGVTSCPGCLGLSWL